MSMSTGGIVPTNGVEANRATVQDVTQTNPALANPHAPPPSGTSGLGPLVRLRTLQLKDLPSHPDLAAGQVAEEQPKLDVFLGAILTEGRAFIDDYLPKHFSVTNRGKTVSPSTATVELRSHTLNGFDLPKEARPGTVDVTENWFARTSIHENAVKEGTASWEEFDGVLRLDHSQNEKAYTDDIFDAHEVLQWPVQAQLAGADGSWTDVHAYIMEMAHELPGPLNNRIFRELVVTAKREQEFLVVQIPVNLTDVPSAKYNNAKNTTNGVYTSIEFGQLLENGTKTKWDMATASDAGGNLPMWAQKMAMPGAIAKDVGFVIDYLQKKRKGEA